jgi:uncharacterized HAD superfamily protein
MHIDYITNSEIFETVRRNLSKLPRGIDGVVFIPKCGMTGAVAVSQFFGKPLYTVDGVMEGNPVYGMKTSKNGRLLVVLDFLGKDTKVLKRANDLLKKTNATVVFALCVGSGVKPSFVDIVLREAGGLAFYESNLFESGWIGQCILGMEGVVCEYPPAGVTESNEEDYTVYVSNAAPLMLPKAPVLAVCTDRLIKYSKQTGEWLAGNKVGYGTLWMLDLPDYETKLSSKRKPVYSDIESGVYEKYKEALLFIEGRWENSLRIFRKTGRPVLCMDRNILLQN